MNFAALPPEVNSIRMYSGPGSGPMLAAAAAWDGLAAELHSAASDYGSVIAALSAESWLGVSAQAMVAAATPYVLWLTATAAHVELTATQARAAAAAYEAAFAMTVPPSVIAANRTQLLTLVASNVLGQNAAAIAAVEAHYAQMWAQDAAAMYGYATAAAPTVPQAPFSPPPSAANPAGTAPQAGMAVQNAGGSAAAGIQGALSQLGSGMPNALAQAASAVALPAQDAVPDLLGLNVLAVAGLVGTEIGLALAGGAWLSADASTREVLNEQNQLYVVQNEILHAIDLFSPLTPSRPDGFTPSIGERASAAVGEAVSVGKVSVPLSWASSAPEIRTLSYTAPIPGDGTAPAVTAAGVGGLGTAFSQMALAGMGGSALAGTVSRGRQDRSDAAPGTQRVQVPAEKPANPVTGIAAEIREFAALRDAGLITDDQYNEQKLRLLGQATEQVRGR